MIRTGEAWRLKRRAAVPSLLAALLPLMGWGVSPASAQAIGAFSDAVVIGSALVERIAGAATESEVCTRARDFLAPIRVALDERH